MRNHVLVVITILIVLAVAPTVQAQDMPQPPQINEQRELQEIGRLQVQLTAAIEYIQQLQAKIAELQKELKNAK